MEETLLVIYAILKFRINCMSCEVYVLYARSVTFKNVLRLFASHAPSSRRHFDAFYIMLCMIGVDQLHRENKENSTYYKGDLAQFEVEIS